MNGYSFNTFTITSEPYYDPILQQYKNILTTNVEPNGPLKQFVTYLRNNNRQQSYFNRQLQPYNNQQPYNINKIVLISLRGANIIAGNGLRNVIPRNLYRNYNQTMNCGNFLMTPNEIPDLITFLQSNNYQIETQITNMMNQSEIKLYNQKLAFTVTYFGGNQPNICYIK
jgi:hypothetical protein